MKPAEAFNPRLSWWEAQAVLDELPNEEAAQQAKEALRTAVYHRYGLDPTETTEAKVRNLVTAHDNVLAAMQDHSRPQPNWCEVLEGVSGDFIDHLAKHEVPNTPDVALARDAAAMVLVVTGARIYYEIDDDMLEGLTEADVHLDGILAAIKGSFRDRPDDTYPAQHHIDEVRAVTTIPDLAHCDPNIWEDAWVNGIDPTIDQLRALKNEPVEFINARGD